MTAIMLQIKSRLYCTTGRQVVAIASYLVNRFLVASTDSSSRRQFYRHDRTKNAMCSMSCVFAVLSCGLSFQHPSFGRARGNERPPARRRGGWYLWVRYLRRNLGAVWPAFHGVRGRKKDGIDPMIDRSMDRWMDCCLEAFFSSNTTGTTTTTTLRNHVWKRYERKQRGCVYAMTR